MSYVLKPRVKTPSTASVIQDSYWRNVLARARANYHRDEQVFSDTSIQKAYRYDNTVGRIAAKYGVPTWRLLNDDMLALERKFVEHVQLANCFAAYHTFARMEALAAKQMGN